MTEPTEEHTTKPVPAMIDAIGEGIYAIRYALVPMYLMLWVALIAYNIQFGREVFDFLFYFSNDSWIPHWRTNDSTHYLLWILSLIDITMIGNLVVMTTVGGFSTFVKEFDLKSLNGRPRWMNGLDSSTLKNKMGMSLIGVSAIHLLKTFMEIVEKYEGLADKAKSIDWQHVSNANGIITGIWIQIDILAASAGIQFVIHLGFIITTLGFAMNAKWMHGHVPKPGEHDEDHH